MICCRGLGRRRSRTRGCPRPGRGGTRVTLARRGVARDRGRRDAERDARCSARRECRARRRPASSPSAGSHARDGGSRRGSPSRSAAGRDCGEDGASASRTSSRCQRTRRRRHDRAGAAPRLEQSGERRDECSVRPAKLRPGLPTTEDRNLVTENQELGVALHVIGTKGEQAERRVEREVDEIRGPYRHPAHPHQIMAHSISRPPGWRDSKSPWAVEPANGWVRAQLPTT